MNLFTRIEQLCALHTISRYRLSKDTGISQGILSDLKSGRRKMLSAGNLKKVASYFNVTIDYLLTED